MKRILALIMAACMIFALCGCGSSTNGGSTAAPAADAQQGGNTDTTVYEFSMNTAYDVNSPMCIAAQKFCDDVLAASDGRLKINLFTNSALGSEKESYIAVAGDELDFTIAGCLGLDMYAPAYSFLSAPFLFKNMDHIRAVMNSELGEGMKQDFLEDNIRTVSIGWRAPRVMSSNRPVYTPDNLAGLKMRVSEMSSWVSIWGPDTLGATAITVALGELYNALQTGVAEASEGPYEQLATYKFYEVQDDVINTDHVYEWVGMFMSDKAYQSLPEDLQKIIDDYAEVDFNQYCTELSEELSDSFLKELTDNGMTVIDPDCDMFREKAFDSYEKWFADTWIVTSFDEIMSYAE